MNKILNGNNAIHVKIHLHKSMKYIIDMIVFIKQNNKIMIHLLILIKIMKNNH